MKIFRNTLIAFVGLVACLTTSGNMVFANSGVTVSPMNDKILLVPGETYNGSFRISNSMSNDEVLYYATDIFPFYLSDENKVIFDETGDYNQIVDWITLDEPTGNLAPGENADIHYTITVPENAPAGGQYAAIKVASVNKDDINKESFALNIEISYGIGYLIYGEVAGNTIKNAEIYDSDVPGFLLSGNITGSSSIKNTGNVHGTAEYTLQIFPLFSGEEVFTNEENPDTSVILPDKTMFHETVWPDTPAVGIFNVVYTVEFEGVTQQVKKMVIKCPIWLLFIIIFAIIALIIFIILKAKNRGKKGSRAKASE